MMRPIPSAHRHRNTTGDFFTHAHEHDVDHCQRDCDDHAVAPQRVRAAVTQR